MNSDPYRLRDPVRVVERKERLRQLRRALDIGRLPDHLWTEKVNLEAKDDQEPLWEFLLAIRKVRHLGLRRW